MRMRIRLNRSSLIGLIVAALAFAGLLLGERVARMLSRSELPLLGKYAPAQQALPFDETAPDSRELAAEAGDFALYIHNKAGGVSVEDRRTGFVWSSIPPGPEGQQTKYACPISLSYVDVTNNITEASNLTYSALAVAWRRIPGGARVSYDATGLKIRVDVEYRLTPDGLAASIPADGIRETAAYRLISVRLLKSFGAVPPGTDGAGLFVPDGCGTIRRVRPHRESLKEFGAYVYGPDFAVNRQRFSLPLANAAQVPLDWKMPEYNRTLTPREHLTLPVFGIYTPKGSMLGIIEAGDGDCSIIAQDDGPAGVNYYRVGPELFYRKADEVSVIQATQRTRPGTAGQPAAGVVQRTQIIAVDPIPIEGERRVLYRFLPPGAAGYASLAESYRGYLRAKGLLPAEPRPEPPGLQLSILCAVDQNHQAGRRLRVLTTFAEAEAMVRRVLEAGVDNLTITLLGWQQGGLHGKRPVNYGADRSLGGDEGLRGLIRFCRARGVKVHLGLDYGHAYAAWHGYNMGRDVAVTRTQEGIMLDQTYPPVAILYQKEELASARRYLTNARAMWERYAERELDRLETYGVDGYAFAVIGEALWSDLSNRHHLTRQQAIAYWRRMLDAFRKTGKQVRVEYGLGYTLGHVDGVAGLPMGDSRCTIFDGPVPFLPMVIAGRVPYWGGYGNMRADGRRQFLRELAYGAFPRYILTYRQSAQLLHTTGEDLAATSASFWFDRIIREWREVSGLQRALHGREITGYEEPRPGCSITRFSGGFTLLVNTTDRPVVLAGRTVGPSAFALAGEGVTP